MFYKISGYLQADATITIVNESNNWIEQVITGSTGNWESTPLISGTKSVFARNNAGDTVIFGGITGVEDTYLGERAVFGQGSLNVINIGILGDAAYFGQVYSRNYISTTSNAGNNRGVWGGGFLTTGINIIDYITIQNINSASVDFGDLLGNYYNTAATSNGINNRGLWNGGGNGNVIQYITISTIGNSIDFGDLIVVTSRTSSCSNQTNNRAIVAGGGNGGNNIIQYYTMSTTGNAIDFGDISNVVEDPAATSNGTSNRGIIMGGTGPRNTIEYITITTPSNATDFGDMITARYRFGATSNGPRNRGVIVHSTLEYININTPSNATTFGNLIHGTTCPTCASNGNG